MKTFNLLFIILCIGFLSCKKQQVYTTEKPTLVIGLVIDQMRYDYLTRFYNRYGDNGFKRILNNGFSLENAHYNYIPTYTASGHASIYTGTTPNIHGIIANWWYDKYTKEYIYCVDDNRFMTIGSDSKDGQSSPHKLLTTTIADQIRLAQNMNGKTIGISFKDRSCVLASGHTATAAYWFDTSKESKVITSSFYMEELPDWVNEFNDSNPFDKYIKVWDTLYDISTYGSNLPDNNIYENTFIDEFTPTFPHDIPSLMAQNLGNNMIKETPFGNSVILDFAKAAIKGENLGKTTYTDFLSVSFSSTDYVGHKYGPDAIETEDTYLRLDKDLGDFFTFLDDEIGKGNYTVFLTSDHGVAQISGYLKSLKIPASYFNKKEFEKYLQTISLKHFNSDKIIEYLTNYQLYLNKDEVRALKLDIDQVSQILADEIIAYTGIYKSVTARALQTSHFSDGFLGALQKGYNHKISGDILFIPKPGLTNSGTAVTTHGTGYSYDTHIPIIFYGKGIKKGTSARRYNIIDIAPTLSNLLKIEFPSGSTGKVIEEVLLK